MNIFVYLIAKGYYIYRNKSRSKIWDNMTTEVCHHFPTLEWAGLLTVRTGTRQLPRHDYGHWWQEVGYQVLALDQDIPRLAKIVWYTVSEGNGQRHGCDGLSMVK